VIPVTAANGRTGRSVVRALVRAGRRVRAFGHAGSRASFGSPTTTPRRTREACSRPTPACP
jgi:uncharacterized protein YbjT (DUF2867 family)